MTPIDNLSPTAEARPVKGTSNGYKWTQTTGATKHNKKIQPLPVVAALGGQMQRLNATGANSPAKNGDVRRRLESGAAVAVP